MSAHANSRRDDAACRPLAAAAIVLATALRGAQAGLDAAGTSATGDDAPAFNLRFAAAMALYKSGDWAHAFAALTALADLGHVPASRLALLMLRYGTGWFRTSFSATPEQVARWARQVLRAPACVPGKSAHAAGSAALSVKAPPAQRAPRPRPDRSLPSRNSSTRCSA